MPQTWNSESGKVNTLGFAQVMRSWPQASSQWSWQGVLVHVNEGLTDMALHGANGDEAVAGQCQEKQKEKISKSYALNFESCVHVSVCVCIYWVEERHKGVRRC